MRPSLFSHDKESNNFIHGGGVGEGFLNLFKIEKERY